MARKLTGPNRRLADGSCMPPSSDDAVGYCRPPRHSQYRPQQSGNPAGRPKGRRNIKTELFEELNEVIEITERGVKKRVTTQRALIKSAIAKAASGNARLLALIFDKAFDGATPDHPTDAISGASDREILDRYTALILAQKERKGGANE